MKYVILAPKPDVVAQTRILFCVAPTLHTELAAAFAATHAPTSAGFLDFTAAGRVETFGRSNSLNLAPAPGDAELIGSFIRGTQAMARDPAPRHLAPASPMSPASSVSSVSS